MGYIYYRIQEPLNEIRRYAFFVEDHLNNEVVKLQSEEPSEDEVFIFNKGDNNYWDKLFTFGSDYPLILRQSLLV